MRWTKDALDLGPLGRASREPIEAVDEDAIDAPLDEGVDEANEADGHDSLLSWC